jgi:hypothetical protein
MTSRNGRITIGNSREKGQTMIEAVLLVLAVAVGITLAMRMDVDPAPTRAEVAPTPVRGSTGAGPAAD